MITVETALQRNMPRFPGDSVKPESALFFDIETTGLSAGSSFVYLIGCVSCENGVPVLRQWMAKSFHEERELLETFFRFAKRFSLLVHYNGDGFDIPYLEIAAGHYGMRSGLTEKNSLDLLKEVRKYKNVFDLSSCRQKDVERFLRIRRDDECNGGELISVYHEYTENRSPELRRLLLLHNHDDLLGLLSILPVANYSFAFSHPEKALLEDPGFSESGKRFSLTMRYPFSFPRYLRYETEDDILLEAEDETVLLTIPSYVGTLRLYYPNPKDYYYLPKEDCAIHKKLAKFVDPGNRLSATKETCYTKADGRFLAAVSAGGDLKLKESFGDKRHYLRYEEKPGFLEEYVAEIFRDLNKKRAPSGAPK